MLPLHDVVRKRHRKVTVKEYQVGPQALTSLGERGRGGGCFNYSLLPKTHGHVNSIVPLLHRRDLDAAMSYDDGGGRMLRRGLLQSP